MTSTAKISARLSGVAIGLAVAAGIVLSGLMPASHAELGGARLSVRVDPTGELGVSPAGRFFVASALEPRGMPAAAAGATEIVNQTASVLAIRVKATGAQHSLAQLLRAAVTVDGRPLVAGPLARLHHWSARAFRLDPGEAGELELRVWLPRATGDGYQARTANLRLAFTTRMVAGR